MKEKSGMLGINEGYREANVEHFNKSLEQRGDFVIQAFGVDRNNYIKKFNPREKIIQMFLDFYDTLDSTAESERLGNIKIYKHQIPLKDGTPVKSGYKLHNPSIELIIQEQISRWLKQGIIVESTSPWSSGLVAVKKHGSNKMRICIDLRLINGKLLGQSHPFPDVK